MVYWLNEFCEYKRLIISDIEVWRVIFNICECSLAFRKQHYMNPITRSLHIRIHVYGGLISSGFYQNNFNGTTNKRTDSLTFKEYIYNYFLFIFTVYLLSHFYIHIFFDIYIHLYKKKQIWIPHEQTRTIMNLYA